MTAYDPEEIVALAQQGEPVADLLELKIAAEHVTTVHGEPVFPTDIVRGAELCRAVLAPWRDL